MKVMRRRTTAQKGCRTIYTRAFPCAATGQVEVPTETVSLKLSEVNNNDSSEKLTLRVRGENTVAQSHDTHQMFAFRHSSISTALFKKNHNINVKKKKQKERKRCRRPLSIYRNTIILLSHKQSDHAPCSVSKFNLVTLSLEPLFISKAIKSIYLYIKGISFFFFLQTTIICFKSQSSSPTSLT